MKYKPIIGLEIHVELKTKSKMFCGCSANYFGKEPNALTCPVCLGLPGALPVPNKKAIKWCVILGLALNCKIPLLSKFDRKNYFYPDLPKGYQISQYDMPLCVKGWINIKSEVLNPKSEKKSKRIGIRRVHMEEDTGKLLHATVDGKKVSLIDFNRSGVPLVEIVTEPDFEETYEVVGYLRRLQQIVRYLDVTNADMERGEMRFEPNISLMINDKGLMIKRRVPSYKVEVKNINSFRFVEKAINYEIGRQRKILDSGKIPIQETRGWDEKKQVTVSQRIKEEAMDYRYFPEPDIPPIRWYKYQISNIKDRMPELPDQRFFRFQKTYKLSSNLSKILIREKSTADFFEETTKIDKQIDPKTIANWIVNRKININRVSPLQLVKKIREETRREDIEEKELNDIINKVIQDNPKAIGDYKRGKKNAITFLLGQLIKTTGRKIDMQVARKKLEVKLNQI